MLLDSIGTPLFSSLEQTDSVKTLLQTSELKLEMWRFKDSNTGIRGHKEGDIEDSKIGMLLPTPGHISRLYHRCCFGREALSALYDHRHKFSSLGKNCQVFKNCNTGNSRVFHESHQRISHLQPGSQQPGDWLRINLLGSFSGSCRWENGGSSLKSHPSDGYLLHVAMGSFCCSPHDAGVMNLIFLDSGYPMLSQWMVSFVDIRKRTRMISERST